MHKIGAAADQGIFRSGTFAACVTLGVMAQAVSAEAAKWKSIDVPGAAATYSSAINDKGVVTGNWLDSNGLTHGFVRASDGTITSFDPREDTGGAYPDGINIHGSVAGTYLRQNIGHGFVRTSDGSITTFNVPNDTYGTHVRGINDRGIIVGYYHDAAGYHAFRRAAKGKISTFDVPGAIRTFASVINGGGVIAGVWADAESSRYRGFVRAADGTFTTFDIPKTTDVFDLNGINSGGEIVGYWEDNAKHNIHAFLRDSGGALTKFNLGNGQETVAKSVNEAGEVTGFFIAGAGAAHGFLRAPDGQITTLDFPNADETVAEGINRNGEIAGYYVKGGVTHGFLLKQ